MSRASRGTYPMPAGATWRNSWRCERSAFTVSVRCFTSCSRVRNAMARACCSTVFGSTNRMVGRSAASTIASTSAASFLLPLDERLDIVRRDQTHRVTGSRHLLRPVMRAGASLHRHAARRLPRHEPDELRPRQLLAEQHGPVRRRAMHLEHVLCEIDADDANLIHVCHLLQLVLRHHEFGTSRCRQGRAASTPSPPHKAPKNRLAALRAAGFRPLRGAFRSLRSPCLFRVESRRLRRPCLNPDARPLAGRKPRKSNLMMPFGNYEILGIAGAIVFKYKNGVA